MIELAFLSLLAVAAAFVFRLFRREHRRRAAAGPVPGIPCMLRRPAGEGRWRAGRITAGAEGEPPGTVRWTPSRGTPVPLPGLVHTQIRVPTVREGMAINPGSRIVRCEDPTGPETAALEIAVMPLDLAELLRLVPPAG
ncbi:hypothetical protein [Streptomyces sp. NPDC012888]|uniref:hypothetical protein n=1 Tax=Streptomyces sp. NPDC012888 TaxID=3364855 RepID=UPI0036A6CF1E